MNSMKLLRRRLLNRLLLVVVVVDFPELRCESDLPPKLVVVDDRKSRSLIPKLFRCICIFFHRSLNSRFSSSKVSPA